ncbi:hypothetical protein FW320_00705 [Azospirillum sp. Vi22]|nr:hypothetical protein [Azospirillum baldaniorum]
MDWAQRLNPLNFFTFLSRTLRGAASECNNFLMLRAPRRQAASARTRTLPCTPRPVIAFPGDKQAACVHSPLTVPPRDAQRGQESR